MLRHAILCFVIAGVVDVIQIASALQIRDINKLIQELQGNDAKYNNERDDQSQELDKNNDYVPITSQELNAIIKQAANDVYNQNRDRKKGRILKRLKYNDERVADEQGENLQQLLSSYNKEEKDPVLDVLSTVFGDKALDVNSQDRVQIDDNEAKVYLVMNPSVNLKEKDLRGINDLLSEILFDQSSKKNRARREPVKKQRRYKGFVVSEKDLLQRRRNRESKELYSPQVSDEEYKPKRSRGDYNAGAGRTPIPYIRHRDIYERD